MTRIGIYPGVFDPVHVGHLKTLQAVSEEYGLQRLIIVPAGNTPNKGLISDSCSHERWKLLSLALEENTSASACSIEINSNSCSYTADTIDHIRSQYANAKLYLIMGEDNLVNLHQWYRSDFILENTTIIAIRRSMQPRELSHQLPAHSNILISDAVADISSSKIRLDFASGISVSSFVASQYEDALYSFGVYLPTKLRSEIDYVRAHQKASRFRHTIGVVKTSLKLASRFAIDSGIVMEAAYLHDIAKELPSEYMRSCAARVPSDLGNTTIDAVIHSPAGAVLAKELFSVSEEVYQAILLHCTLDVQMTLLDKIIYISDMVEPSRHYPAVIQLRQAFDSVQNEHDLDLLLILAIELNICYISSIGGIIHPASLRALSLLKNKINL